MIYVTQGHEKSIALEIFLKSFLTLSEGEQKLLSLVCAEETFAEHLKFMGLERKLFKNLAFIEIKQSSLSLTLESLLTSLSLMKEGDILLTLPTSKDQLKYEGKNHLGYTEFLRSYKKTPELAMTFKADEEFVLLMTDHVPLKDVPALIKKDFIIKKLSLVLDEYKKYFSSLDEVIVAGLNPHAGEGGLLGLEDEEISLALSELRQQYPQVKFVGPLSGDTLHFHKKEKLKQLMVYMFHDQGLPVFKAQHGLKGINMTLGLPYLRMSVDHGTAFDLYGKNQASPEGCLYVLKTALEIEKQKRVSYGL